MKITTVNNVNFSGVFTDKKWHNMGKWSMEYAPYSWESNNTSRMTHKEKIDMLASTLPDNEEFYKAKANGYARLFESSEDVLGTVSYYRDFEKNEMGKTITEVPAMNRETSLDFLRKKLEKFMKLKKAYGEQIQSSIKESMSRIDNLAYDYDKHSKDYDANFSLAKNSNNHNKENMDINFEEVINENKKIYNSSKEYVKLRDSMDELRINIESARHEVEKLKEARLGKNLIDISRRDVYDPNKPLWDALQDIRTAYGKLVALPHKTTSVNELISEAGVKLTDTKFSDKIIKFVDELIKKRV